MRLGPTVGSQHPPAHQARRDHTENAEPERDAVGSTWWVALRAPADHRRGGLYETCLVADAEACGAPHENGLGHPIYPPANRAIREYSFPSICGLRSCAERPD